MSRNVLKNLYGVGFSPLSIKNKRYGFSEELMAAKDAGMVAILQKDGSVLSSEYILRSKKHLQEFTTQCIHDNTLGKVYKISPDENLVQNITRTDNLFVNELEYDNGTDAFQFVRFNLEYDCFAKEDSAIMNLNDIRVKINFSITAGEDSKHYEIDESIVDINNKAFAFDYDEWHTEVEGEEYKFTVNTFTIELPETFDPEKVGLIIYDILMVLR